MASSKQMRHRQVEIPYDSTLAEFLALVEKHDAPQDATIGYETEDYYGSYSTTMYLEFKSPETPAERKQRLADARKHREQKAARKAKEDEQIEAAYLALKARREALDLSVEASSTSTPG